MTSLLLTRRVGARLSASPVLDLSASNREDTSCSVNRRSSRNSPTSLPRRGIAAPSGWHLERSRPEDLMFPTLFVMFPADDNDSRHQTTFQTAWRLTLRRAKMPHFRIYDLRTTHATPLSAGVADEWVTQLLRQGDAKVFK